MSKPGHIKIILPAVMRDIEARCNRRRKRQGLPLLGEEKRGKQNHHKRVLAAIGGFMETRKTNRRTKE